MKLIAMEKDQPGATAADFAPHLKAEARCVWELYQQGIIRELYFHADRHEAILILECEDVAQAQAALAMLPLVQAKLIEFDIIPLIPYPGFARLFAT